MLHGGGLTPQQWRDNYWSFPKVVVAIFVLREWLIPLRIMVASGSKPDEVEPS